MNTECKTESIQFHALGSREVRGQFDGGDISTDAGGLLLREAEKRTGILKQLAGCFQDHRDPRFVEHGSNNWCRNVCTDCVWAMRI